MLGAIKKFLKAKKTIKKHNSYIIKDHRRFFNLFYKTTCARKSCCESGIDLFLRSFFQDQKKGFYVCFGALYPQVNNPTWLLYRQGWYGLHVDPSHESEILFSKRRKRDRFVISAAGDNKYHLFMRFEDTSFNTFDEARARQTVAQQGKQPLDRQDVHCQPMSTILKENLDQGQKIDLMIIDQYHINELAIKSNDFEEYRPHLLVVNFYEMPLHQFFASSLGRYLKKKEYDITAAVFGYLVFRDRNTAE